MSKTIFIINGPNLNLLGKREPEIYGNTSLSDLKGMCEARASDHGLQIFFEQSNSEAQILEWIHKAIEACDGLIINAGAFTHTSLAILDALKNVHCPIIEVHISNPHQRESFRHHSYVTFAATGSIVGLGTRGYILAIDALAEMLMDLESTAL